MKMPHLNNNAAMYLERSNAERISYIHSNKWINYDAAKKIILKMEDLLLHPDTHRMPCILIKAETNNGKSTILNRFAELHPIIDDFQSERLLMPVVAMEMPSAPKPDSIYIGILRSLKLPFKDSYSKELKVMMIKEGIKDFDVKMLLIDEFHVIMNTTKLLKMQLLDTIKYLSNQLRIPIVAAGTKEAHVALMSDGQLANRFEPYLLPQWQLTDEFRRLLLSFEKKIPLMNPSNLSHPDMTTKIYAETEGWIGEVHAYLSKAAERAIETGSEQISQDILHSIDWLSPSKRRIVG